LSEGTFTVELEIREGAFYPEDKSWPSLLDFAFAERGKQLQIPGPMIYPGFFQGLLDFLRPT
jgi:hypothetical protein